MVTDNLRAMILPALILLPTALALLLAAARARPPRTLGPGSALALVGFGVHLAVASSYGVLMLPFSGNLAFASISAAALLFAAAVVLWASRAPLDDDDDDRRDPDDPDPGDSPPSSDIDWDALERELHERVALSAPRRWPAASSC